MYNKVILSGNLTRDVEIRYTQGGSAIGKTAIATSRRFKSQTGEQKEEVMFIDLTLFGGTAEIANQYLRKGSKVLVDGRLTLDQWTAQDGSKRSKHSVTVETLQMLGSREQTQNGNSHEAQSQGKYSQPQNTTTQNQKNEFNGQSQQSAPNNIPEFDINSEQIPF